MKDDIDFVIRSIRKSMKPLRLESVHTLTATFILTPVVDDKNIDMSKKNKNIQHLCNRHHST